MVNSMEELKIHKGELKNIDGFLMKNGFIYKTNKYGNVLYVVTGIDGYNKSISRFDKKIDGTYKHEFYWFSCIKAEELGIIIDLIEEYEDEKEFGVITEEQAEQIARNFLETGEAPFGTFEEEFQAYNDGRPPVYKTYANFPKKVASIIYNNAKENGWDGCHWDDPLLIEIDSTAKDEYEAEYGTIW